MVIAGESALALALEEAAVEAGWDVATPAEAVDGPVPFLILEVEPRRRGARGAAAGRPARGLLRRRLAGGA